MSILIKTMWYVYTMEYYSAIKKNEIVPFTSMWMDLEFIILCEVRHRKDKFHMISLICGTVKTDTNELIKQKQTHRLREQTYGYQRGKEGQG